jgi:hypothetical protein
MEASYGATVSDVVIFVKPHANQFLVYNATSGVFNTPAFSITTRQEPGVTSIADKIFLIGGGSISGVYSDRKCCFRDKFD